MKHGETFGSRIVAIRKARGISQRWLARESGLSSAYMSQLETKGFTPSADILERLADVLGYTMDDLWRGDLVAAGSRERKGGTV